MMNMKHVLSAGLATVLLASGVTAFAADVRDPGRLPRPDKDRDRPAAAPVSASAKSTTTAQAEDHRDPGHAVVPEKSRDTVRRR